LSPDGKAMATGNWEGHVRLWDIATGKEQRLLKGHRNSISAVAFSPDGGTLASASADRTIRLWDVRTGAGLYRVEAPPQEVHSLTFSPEGRTLAFTANRDRRIHLCEVVTGKERAHLEGHEEQVNSLAFCPDGKTLVSGSADTTILLWAVPGRRDPGQKSSLRPEEFRARWDDLASLDARRAYAAIRLLSGAGQEAVAFIGKSCRPVPSASPEQVARLLADLDSNRYAVRARAIKELEGLEEGVAPALREARCGRPTLEVRRRLDLLLERLGVPVRTGGRLQAFRAVEVLESIGSPEAEQVLKTLSKGVSEARLTREAKAALQRLRRK